MDLDALRKKILSDETEGGRRITLHHVYSAMDDLRGYKRTKLGETRYGPVYFFEEGSKKEKDMLLLGGLHPFCEGATVASVLYAMEEKHDYNRSAVPLVSPWAFVAPVTNRQMLGRYYGGKFQRMDQYKDTNYHMDPDPVQYSKELEKCRACGDIGRLARLDGRKFDIVAECHMDYSRGNPPERFGAYMPTYEVELMLLPAKGHKTRKTLSKLSALLPGVSCRVMDHKSGYAFLVKEDGLAVTLETHPDDVTLFKQCTDALARI